MPFEQNMLEFLLNLVFSVDVKIRNDIIKACKGLHGNKVTQNKFSREVRKMLFSRKKVLVALSIMMVSALALTGCGGDKKAAAPAASGQKMVLRYAENQVKDYPTTKAAVKFGELVKDKTKGRITVEVYDSAQLGDEKSVIEQIQFGGIDMARVSLSPLSEFAKQLNVLQLPYLYRDGAHMWKVLDGKIGQDLLATLDKSGIVGLTWFDAGARNFYTKNPAKTIADLKGLKIRVQESSMMMDMVKAVGANPTPMAYGEVYSALQTGVIDGAENNWPSYESTRHFEVAKYYMIDEHNRVPEPMIISKKTMDKISPEDQKIIRECAVEAGKVERELWAAREKTSEKKVRDGGSTITTLTPEQHQAFVNAVKPLYEKYGADVKDLIKQIQDVK
jgi:tripartite ATP-independent transporter DctP family solute receptor